jgi:hypothetical protein
MKILRLVLLITTLSAPCAICCGQNCWQSSKEEVRSDTVTMWNALRHAPRAMAEPHNLKWEIPVAAATGVLIGVGDTRVANQVSNSPSLNGHSDTASTVITDSLVGASAATYLVGCFGWRQHALSPGLSALTATGFAVLNSGVLKLSTNRQRPNTSGSTGEFWDGGNSFPSGHTTAAWAVASSLAHSYPQHRWVKWGAYSAAIAVGVLRITAHKHYPSDVMIGGTLGYVVGEEINRP